MPEWNRITFDLDDIRQAVRYAGSLAAEELHTLAETHP